MLLTAAALILATAGAAVATIGPPISFRLIDAAGPAQAGKTYKGTLEIIADEPIHVEGFRLEGAGWKTMSLDAPADSDVAKSSRLAVRFSAVPVNTDEPLVVAFELGDLTVRHPLDLSERHYRRMKEGLSARPVPAGEPRFTPKVTPFAATASTPTPLPDKEQIHQAPAGAQTYNVTVTGGWYYLHPLVGWLGAEGMKVSIWRAGTLFTETLAVTGTAENGRFSATVAWDPLDGPPHVGVTISTAGTNILVHDFTYDQNYAWSCGTWSTVAGGSIDIGDLTSGDESMMPAMHIMSMMSRNWAWHNSFGYNVDRETVFWPADGQYHNSAGVHISDSWHEGGYAHEYGHHWQTVFAPVPPHTYCNGICDFEVCTHCGWCSEAAPVPTMEGFCYWLGDVVPRAIELDTGIPINAADYADTLSMCGDVYDFPNQTEGFYAALLRDIYDATPDTHYVYGPWRDSLTENAHEILAVVHQDNPSTPMDFLNALIARYPGLNMASLWETALNCGFGLDTTAPGVVTNLASTSHAVNVSSPDQTINFSWTPATDAMSGIVGYGITVANSWGLPSAIQDIGKVSTYTTSALPPGTWYFSLRAKDRAGNWSSSYAHVGPYIVRDPQPSDLQTHLSFGWTRPLVPREDATAMGTNVLEPVTLAGNTAQTYWNLNGLNDGESATGAFSSRVYVDDVYVDARSWTNINAGGNYMVTNDGPLTIRGGRHTLSVFHDALEQVAETDETDNKWAHQWVWSPLSLTIGALTTRPAPPGYQAGWNEIVDGSAISYNCDGLSFASILFLNGGASWDAVYLYATDNAVDYDCRMHTHTTGASSGFTGSNQGWSARSAGYLDAVIVNGLAAGVGTRDVGVLNDSGGSSDYRAMRLRAGALALDDSVTAPMAQYEMMLMRRFEVAAADTGWYTITVSVDAPAQPFQLQCYLPTFQTGTISNYDARAATTTGRLSLNRHLTAVGAHALLVYRDPINGTDARTFTIEMERTPPDFTPAAPSGWYAPFVPRPLRDGTTASAARPDTLHGNANATYFNYSRMNDSPVSWTWDGQHLMNANAIVDGSTNLGGVGISTLAANQIRTSNQTDPRTVAGGRHVTAMVLDLNNDITELDETNNVYGEQYCWSPLPLPFATPIVRPAPPDRTGGWSQISSGETRWYNCDGLRLAAGGAESWRAVATMPGTTDDIDLRLHSALWGTKGGFTTSLTNSAWGLGQSDIVLVCAHDFIGLPAMAGTLDVGVTRVTDSLGYTSEAVLATALTPGSSETWGPFTLAAQHVMHLYSLWLTPDTWALRLDNLTGTVDWGLSLYAPDGPFKNKSGTMTDGLAYLNAGGQAEWLTVAVPTAGWYALAVWKVGAADLALGGSYHLRLNAGVSEVPGDTPPAASILSLTAAHPNPFNPQTRLVYNLAAAGPVRLDIYDLRGICVRTLVATSQVAGRHEAVWDGRDNGGQAAASGSYVVRLATEQGVRTSKVTLAK
jgi:hypothetical protein